MRPPRPVALSPSAPLPVASPHRAAVFRTPGSTSLVVASASARGVPVSTPVSALRPSEGARVASGGRLREVNSAVETKPVPGQFVPVSQSRVGARPPPSHHPAMVMRQTNGALPPGARPPPPSVPRPRGVPPNWAPRVRVHQEGGPSFAARPPRPRQPQGGRVPPPEALARLRARGPPAHSPAVATGCPFAPPLRPVASGHVVERHQPTRHQHGHATAAAAAAPAPAAEAAEAAEAMAAGADVKAAVPYTEGPRIAPQREDGAVVQNPPKTADDKEAEQHYNASDGEVDSKYGATDGEETWREMWDEEVQAHYYYNVQSGEASWIRPDSFQEDMKGEDMSSNMSLAEGSEESEWERYWDDEAGAFYMHNPSTGKTRWATEMEGIGWVAEAKE